VNISIPDSEAGAAVAVTHHNVPPCRGAVLYGKAGDDYSNKIMLDTLTNNSIAQVTGHVLRRHRSNEQLSIAARR
jgi:hypothetical protein